MNAVDIRGTTNLGETIASIGRQMAEAGDAEHAGKLEQLAAKASAHLLHIAFCGHFSAGKSSLINKLCGHPLLPSSPIPTSANVVTIASGEPSAVVKHAGRGDGAEAYKQVPLEELDDYCRNGEAIESIDIRYPIHLLGDRAALVDTPGIDSTDGAHKLATESALHMADVVFYVMDYNHVQSEINFEFTKRLQEWGKPLYLIVNMIDKHRDRELSFEAYRDSVARAFESWHIQPDGILYTSVREADHAHNEWEKLVWLIGRLTELAEPLREDSLAKSVAHLIREHGKWLADRNEERKAELRAELEREGGDELLARHAELERRIAECGKQAEQLREKWRQEVARLLDNANVTPAKTRDLAHHYLQSRKPGFKAGLFARAATTAKEIAARLEAFAADYAEQVEANIVWHLRGLLVEAGEPYGVGADAADAALAGAKSSVGADWLAAQVQPGAVASGEYTLNYAKAVAAETKSVFRRAAFDCIDAIAARAAAAADEEAAALKRELERLQARLSAWRQLQALERDEREREQALRAQFPFAPADMRGRLPDPRQFAGAARAAEAAPRGGDSAAAPRRPAISLARGAVEEPAAPTGGPAESGRHFRATMSRAAAKLGEAWRLLEPIPSMRSIVQSMREKADRLADSRFTIALFGAFSAGKSSFANALMGEAVLPVSPNPTTAAINKIMPPTSEWPHGSVKVKMKSAEAILDDVLYSLAALGAEAEDMDGALAQIGRLSPDRVGPTGKPHYAFLQAVRLGWEEARGSLGREIAVDLERFNGYVASESKACFVEYIELYYSCPLTEQGMILVDTPGADSINARHTGIAFNYIKNADAILFVTYYNHAFSQADREFLLQLGRVKDSFELDKMFFLVNAADLAASERDLEDVVAHVQDNLLRYGIREPRIYPVSSLMALEGKQRRDAALTAASGMSRFEAEFIRFAVEELAGIAVRSADRELERAESLLGKWMASAREGEAERERRLAVVREARGQAEQLLADTDTSADETEAAKEMRELLYYVKQRIGFRFGELFQYAFNPAALREDAGPMRSLMRAAWFDLLRLIGYDLSQELYATTLRIENVLNRLAQKRQERLEGRIRELLEGFEAGAYEAQPFPTPDVAETLEAHADERWLAGFYKNGKQFFEGPGKSQLKDALEQAVSRPIADCIERHGDLFEQHYAAQYRERIEAMQQRLERIMNEHAEGLLAALEMKIDLGQLERTKSRLEALRRG
jgi:GTPase Era involved in 16S rRNA processing